MPPAFERRDLRRVDVEAQHVVADFGEAGAGDQADVAGADDGDFHAVRSPKRRVDRGERGERIGGLRDRAPDHEVVGAVGDRGLGRDRRAPGRRGCCRPGGCPASPA